MLGGFWCRFPWLSMHCFFFVWFGCLTRLALTFGCWFINGIAKMILDFWPLQVIFTFACKCLVANLTSPVKVVHLIFEVDSSVSVILSSSAPLIHSSQTEKLPKPAQVFVCLGRIELKSVFRLSVLQRCQAQKSNSWMSWCNVRFPSSSVKEQPIWCYWLNSFTADSWPRAWRLDWSTLQHILTRKLSLRHEETVWPTCEVTNHSGLFSDVYTVQRVCKFPRVCYGLAFCLRRPHVSQPCVGQSSRTVSPSIKIQMLLWYFISLWIVRLVYVESLLLQALSPYRTQRNRDPHTTRDSHLTSSPSIVRIKGVCTWLHCFIVSTSRIYTAMVEKLWSPLSRPCKTSHTHTHTTPWLSIGILYTVFYPLTLKQTFVHFSIFPHGDLVLTRSNVTYITFVGAFGLHAFTYSCCLHLDKSKECKCS